MNIVRADFDWISLVFILFALLTGWLKSSGKRKQAGENEDDPFPEESDSFPKESDSFPKEVQIFPVTGDLPEDGQAPADVHPSTCGPLCGEGSIPSGRGTEPAAGPAVVAEEEGSREEQRPDFDIRQAVISSEILRRPEF